jgi:hypothetical protein
MQSQYPKYAVYWDDPDDSSLGVLFFVSLEQAKAKVKELIALCERASAEHERMLDWDITVLEILAEVHDSPDGLMLYPARDSAAARGARTEICAPRRTE